MLELLYKAHDVAGDRALQNALLVALLVMWRRAPALFAAVCVYLASIGRRVGVADETTGEFVKLVREHTAPHRVPTAAD